MKDAPYEPKGTRFIDAASRREMILIGPGEPLAGWLCYRHAEGHWVTLRAATEDDLEAIAGVKTVTWIEVNGRPAVPVRP